MTNLRSVKGCKDLMQSDMFKFNYIVEAARNKAELYGCSEISTPILEHTEVFSRTLGEFSDVVHKEMYSFIDQGKHSLTLRPEFTAGIMRAVFSNGLQNQLPLKLFCFGPLFRRERPQAGRHRQFHQINVEFLGFDKPHSDAEAIKLGADILEELEIKNYTLEINSLGCELSKKKYEQILFEYFNDYRSNLSAISKIRLENNPLRILDSKEEEDKALILAAPKIQNYYTLEAQEYFQQVLANLELLKVAYKINSNIVRGLDYYSHTAFEFVSNEIGAQSAIIAGGRYDGLSKIMGNLSIPAVGFAGGIERLMMLSNKFFTRKRPVLVLPISNNEQCKALEIVDTLRQSGISSYLDSGKKIGDVIQKAVTKHNAQYMIILGSKEIEEGVCNLKNLDSSSQETLRLEEIVTIMRAKYEK